MSLSALKAMLAGQQQSALAAMQSSKLSAERTDALMYYNADMSKDMPALEGRSSAVSTDVLDTIEGLMPSLMEVFAGSEEVVTFNPIGPEDVQAAQQETDYVNHVFMQQNPGFMVLYSFIKDALLSKVGIVKVWWEEREEEENETYYDLTDDQFAVISADEDVEITEHTEKPIEDPQLQQETQSRALHDAKVTKSKKYAEAKVLGVPPEEFGIEKGARSIKTCNYCFHKVLRTEDELIQQGFDEDQIRSLPTYAAITNTEEIERDTVFEHQNVGEDMNKASRQIQVVEHYIRMDYEGDGRACLYRVTTGSQQGEVLLRDGKPDVIEFDEIPFAALTPVPVTHRFFGKSVADLVMDIQRIKTALLRGGLDGLYIHNNPRVVVSEQHASDSTLDDLLISRPNQIVRVKMPGGIEYQQSPDVSASVFPAMEYFDTIRETRTGVAKNGQPLDPKALQDVSATAANLAFTASQARMRLIARIFADTGIKDLFILLHGLIRKHGQEARTFRLNNRWVTVDPRDWKKRNDMTVHVGLGSGGKAEQMAAINMIIAMQEKALMGGMTNLVLPQNLYTSARWLTRIAGHKDTDAFFTDPTTQPAPQAPPDPKIQALMMQAQLQDKKQQVDAAHQQAKMQADAVLEQQKFEHEKELAFINLKLDMADRAHAQRMAEMKANLDAQLARHKIQLARQKANPDAPIDTSEDPLGISQETLAKFGEQLAQMHADHHAPIQLIHRPDGKIAGGIKGSRKLIVQRDHNDKPIGIQSEALH